MKWLVLATTVLVAGVTCLPIDDVEVPATELLPPKMDSVEPASDLIPPKDDYAPIPMSDLEAARMDDGPTLATDLVPPPLPEEFAPANKKPATLYLVNVFAVKNNSNNNNNNNNTDEESNDVLHDDVIKEVPDDIAEPLALFLLVVEDENEKEPVSLDEVAKDLEEEGFTVERVVKDGETRVIKVDLNSAETIMKIEQIGGNNKNAIDIVDAKEVSDKEDPPLEQSGKLMKIRRKRSICLKCKLDELKYGGGCGGGCGGGGGGGGGGGYYPQPQPVYHQPVQVQPIIVVPVQGGHKKYHHGGGGGGGGGHYPQQPYYPPPQQPYYPPQQQCNTCGGYGHGGGNSYASAQASASANSYRY